MADETAGKRQASRGEGNKVPDITATGVKRTRKQYAHTLSEPEKFALQTVQRAQGALRVVNDAIKSGKPVNPEIVKACLDFSKQAADMLFGTT